MYHYVLRQQSGHGHTCKCYSCLDITVNEVQIGIPVHTSTFFYCSAQSSFNMAVDTLDQYIGLLNQKRSMYWYRLTLLTYHTSYAVEDRHFFLRNCSTGQQVSTSATASGADKILSNSIILFRKMSLSC